MKNTIVCLAALSVVAMAGGDFVAVEEAEIPMIDNSAYYLGLGVGQATLSDAQTIEEVSSPSIILQAGYQYNEYIALEGRISLGFNSDYEPGLTSNVAGDYDEDVSSWGIYIKPMYPVTDVFNIYALLGYGGLELGNLESGDATESGFQWGLGVNYDVTEAITVFVDYVQLYDDVGFDYRAQLEDIDADAWTLGVSYKF